MKQTKFLGVLLDNHLTFKPHVNYTKCKLSKNIGIMKKAKQYLNKKSLLSLYYAFIYPYLMYCIIIWGGCNKTTLDPIIKVQKRISYVSKYTSSLSLFNDLNVLEFEKVYKLQVILFVYKFKSCLLPNICNNLFVKTSDVHDHETRQMYDYYPPRYRTEYAKRNVKYAGCILWNMLDTKTKKFDGSLSSFKKHIIKSLK